MLGQSVRTKFCSDRILLGRGHSARVECSDGILFGSNSARPLLLCSGRVFGQDSVRPEFCSTVVTLLGQSVRMGYCSDRILLGRCHSARAKCSDKILFGQNYARPWSLCSGRVFGLDSVRIEFCSPVVTLLEQSVQTTSSFSLFPSLGRKHVRNFSVNSSSEESNSSSSSERVPTSGSEVGTSNPQLPLPSTSHPFQPSTSQPLPPSSSQPSHSLSRKNALGDVKDQADIRLIPNLGWYARLPGLQEPPNYGTKFETGVYEEQVKSGYRLPLHLLALRFFEHYRMAPGQLVPNGWRKLAGLIYLVQTSGYKPDATDFMRVFFEICFVKRVANCPGWYYIHSRQRLLKGGPKSNKGWHSRYFFVGHLDKGELPFDRDWNPFCLFINEPLSEEQLEWAKIIPPGPIPAGLLIPSPPRAIPSMTSAQTVPLEMASGSGKSPQGGFLGVLQKAKGKHKEKQPSAKLPHVLKKTRVTPPECSPRILEQVSIDDDPIFRPRWTLRCDDLGMPDSQVSEQHLLYGILPRDKEVFQTQTHETFACSFAQAVYIVTSFVSTRWQQMKLNRRGKLLRTHKKLLIVTKARDQGIRDFLDGNAGDEWLKKRTDDGLEIYELGFAKAKEMFAERFPDIPLGDFVLPAIVSPSGETVMPSDAGDAAASHLLGEGPSGDAPKP
ncbi:hypothetical protein RJ639_015493 [Escallonia herrerae]|uniref:Transposase (putative) gypsy type domain-containing protein n=1 Tax=Escallonia herrerae TaxID=1293975 RepID=A0AA89AKX2_9ASTE|nr:hypothetical protein RJ639_015493 [Escallonia herrerae]